MADSCEGGKKSSHDVILLFTFIVRYSLYDIACTIHSKIGGAPFGMITIYYYVLCMACWAFALGILYPDHAWSFDINA